MVVEVKIVVIRGGDGWWLRGSMMGFWDVGDSSVVILGGGYLGVFILWNFIKLYI